jgi:hypothetical protein
MSVGIPVISASPRIDFDSFRRLSVASLVAAFVGPGTSRHHDHHRAILPPMKFLRTLLVLLLCAVLPLTGLAANCTAGDCPMQQPCAMTMHGAMPNCDSMHSSHGGKAKGTSCEMNAQCHIGSQSIPAAPLQVTRPAGFSSPIVFSYTQVLPVREPSGLWRPPRAV